MRFIEARFALDRGKRRRACGSVGMVRSKSGRRNEFLKRIGAVQKWFFSAEFPLAAHLKKRDDGPSGFFN